MHADYFLPISKKTSAIGSRQCYLGKEAIGSVSVYADIHISDKWYLMSDETGAGIFHASVDTH